MKLLYEIECWKVALKKVLRWKRIDQCGRLRANRIKKSK